MKIKHIVSLSVLTLLFSSCGSTNINNAPGKYTPRTLDESWTILTYLCGSTLESTVDQGQLYALATEDITEMLSVKNQPTNVNIVIETGGASRWSTKYGISANKSERYHIRDKKLIKDSSVSKKNMGDYSTLQSFVEYGLTNYPADHVGLILWNHGGAMQGVCQDEYTNDTLTNSEVQYALSSAFTNLERTKKLDFIGYDACLMSVQDIADFNSEFADYMVASEETEDGYGWAYDQWMKKLYAGESVTTILNSICDSFIAAVDDLMEIYEREYPEEGPFINNQTLAVLDLSKMDAYRTAFESLASTMASSTISSRNFKTLMKSIKSYGDTQSYWGVEYGYNYYGTFDAYDFFEKISNNYNFSSLSQFSNKIDACKLAFNDVISHFAYGEGAKEGEGGKNSYGMCLFFSMSSNCDKDTYYATTETNFTNWRAINNKWGS